MKKFNRLIVPYAMIFLIFLSFISSCTKENVKQEELTTEQIIEQLAQDNNFKTYADALTALAVSSVYSQNSTVVSSSEFDDHFKKSIVENNKVSRQIISAFMGFNNVEDFWAYREKINSSFSQLLNKYDLKKLNHAQWISLISNQKKSVTLLNNNIQPFAVTLNGGAISADKCHEVYNNCIDKAIASYAEAQVVCIAFGALGFTLVGGVLFTLCEGAAYYSLNVSKKSCSTDFRFCIVQ